MALKKHKTKHDWIGKVLHWEIRKRKEFDHAEK